jgi:hypothetical protein
MTKAALRSRMELNSPRIVIASPRVIARLDLARFGDPRRAFNLRAISVDVPLEPAHDEGKSVSI